MSEHSVIESTIPALGPRANEAEVPAIQSACAAEETSPESSSRLSSGKNPQHKRLRLGDLVEINRNSVNCRAWMSTVATSRCKLRRGDRGILLSDPVRFEQHYWVKVSLDHTDTVGYVSARYLDVIQSRPISTPDIVEPSVPAAARRERYQAGDYLTTSIQLGLRTGPGIHHPIVQEINRNSLGIALDAPTLNGSVAWVPVRFPNGSGWIASQHSQFFARQSKWIEVNLSTQELIAWDDALRVSNSPISSGKPGYPTPAGAFTITRKIPVRRLRATVRGERWDIPGVPWLLAFRRGGFYLHAAYWHNEFGTPFSHGCVTLPVDYAEWLYEWTPSGTPIWIHY